MHLTAQLLSGHFASSLMTCGPEPELWEEEKPFGPVWRVRAPRATPASPQGAPRSKLSGARSPTQLSPCPTCLQGLQRANRCGRAFEISVPYKFKVFGNGFLINLPTLSFWKRQKSQIHSRFNLPWYFLSRWLKSCLSCVLCSRT